MVNFVKGFEPPTNGLTGEVTDTYTTAITNINAGEQLGAESCNDEVTAPNTTRKLNPMPGTNRCQCVSIVERSN